MDDNTKFLLRRIDDLEKKLLKEIKELQRETQSLQLLKHKALGFIFGVSFVVSAIVQMIFHKIGS